MLCRTLWDIQVNLALGMSSCNPQAFAYQKTAKMATAKAVCIT